jgi:hypothetical protein
MPTQSIEALSDKTPIDRRGAMLDLFLVVLTLVVIKQALLPITQLYAGPVSTFSAMIVATFLLRRRGLRWADLGFRRPVGLLKTIGLVILIMFVFILFAQTMTVIADQFFIDPEYGSRFDHVEGNLTAYIIIMGLVWTHGSFFEELLFRAFIMTKTSEACGDGLWGAIIALFASSAFFGYRHAYYQGVHGALVTGAGGFAFGLFYLWLRRTSILPIIFAHGIFNTLGQTFRYLGIDD